MKKVLFLISLVSLLTACGGSPAPIQPVTPDESISIESSAFMPKAITIKVGDTVEWINQDGNAHTVTGEGFDSGELTQGASFSYTFDQPGSYNYQCTIHPSMTGTINVQ